MLCSLLCGVPKSVFRSKNKYYSSISSRILTKGCVCMCVHACLVFYLQSRTALCLRFAKFVKAHQMMTDDSLLVPLADLEKLSQEGGKAEASGTPTPLVSGDENSVCGKCGRKWEKSVCR